MILGNQVEWALHCMATLGRVPEGVSIPAKLLAELHDIPKEYLSKAMQQLANAGLVETSFGPKGGYRLMKSPAKISMLEIVEAIEGKKNTFNCQEIRKNIPCAVKTNKKMKLPVCSIAAVMYEADDAWRDVLRHKKLSDLMKDVSDTVSSESLEYSLNWLLDRVGV